MRGTAAFVLFVFSPEHGLPESAVMIRDLLYALRVLRKSPIATAVTILALALGIGANTVSFVSVQAIVLHPFAYPNLNRIMTVWGTQPKSGLKRAAIAAADFEDWKRQNRSFELLSAYQPWTVNITGADRPVPVQAARVGPGFFRIFGLSPTMGRTFEGSEAGAENIRFSA